MLKAARISALILLLACSARAGYIQTGGSPEPPPPPPSSPAVEPTGSTGEPIADGNTQSEEAGVLTQVALNMLAALPLLF